MNQTKPYPELHHAVRVNLTITNPNKEFNHVAQPMGGDEKCHI